MRLAAHILFLISLSLFIIAGLEGKTSLLVSIAYGLLSAAWWLRPDERV